MSRIGKKPIDIPEGVLVEQKDNFIFVQGPKGNLKQDIPSSDISLEISENQILVKRKGENSQARAFHGLTRSLIANMIEGVNKGFEKNLQMSGVGYRSQVQGDELILSVGFSHLVNFKIPKGIKIEVEDRTKIKVFGINKQLVGQVAAEIRAIKPCEPYKGKGIKYKDEIIRRKAGKAMKAAKV